MQVAIFSDVHGNLTALEAVLEHIGQQVPDLIVFAGDLCVFGARPSACVARLHSRQDILSIHGNTDKWIEEPPRPQADMDDATKARLEALNVAATWARAQLADTELSWLQRLPFSYRLGPTNRPQDDLLIVHANPLDVNQAIFPTTAEQQARIGKVKYEQTDEELEALLAGVTAAVVAYGHVHFPNVRPWREMTLANVSSTSLPLDGDTRAKYGLLTWRNGRWTVEPQFVAYDLEAEKAALRAEQPPEWADLIEWIEGKR